MPKLYFCKVITARQSLRTYIRQVFSFLMNISIDGYPIFSIKRPRRLF